MGDTLHVIQEIHDLQRLCTFHLLFAGIDQLMY